MYESGWGKALRVLAIVFIVLGIIGSFVSLFSPMGSIIGLAIGIVAIAIFVAAVMVFLEIAWNTSISAQATLKILEHLERRERPPVSGTPSTTCIKCNKIFDMSFNNCPHCGYRDDAKKPTLSSLAAKSAGDVGGGWICGVCEDANLATSRTCKGCGKER